MATPLLRRIWSKIYIACLLLLASLMAGTAGYKWIEGYSTVDAIYMSIITLSTVGFSEVSKLSESGRLFTIFYIVFNIGIFTYSISSIISFFFDGEFKRQYQRYKIDQTVKGLKNHVIVCGFGRNGKQTVQELKNHKIPYVVIEHSEERASKLDHQRVLVGDARDDRLLEAAGIQNARALITTLPDDADNVFVVLTAREVNKSLTIISRASNDGTEKKLKIAGADNVIMPDKVGGSHMASLVIKPDVMEFIDVITGQRGTDIQIEELSFEHLSERFRNKSILELNIRQKTGANIIGFKRPEGDYVINPQPDFIFEHNSKIIVLGTSEQIAELVKYYKD